MGYSLYYSNYCIIVLYRIVYGYKQGKEIHMRDYRQIYWDKLAGGELWLQFCPVCNQYIFYSRERCPHCLQDSLEWKPVKGRGRLHSYTVVHVSALPEFKDQVPYICALVELDEGVRMPSNLIDCSLDKIQIEMTVEMAFIERSGKLLPVFRPARN